ncbi:uncharacterized protein PITG_11195 [Phytophthora infestans T30-4]|uniref:Uncharacterized protein n=1 Tax=Phytophthora infestans (strain T30-4) TaxID=403677 RepID=D0NGE6_PHYIT|nr:uncharacterized protein PITG_11195 [Phytophthora infestans T30-4]EEY57347.1 conserved hypothetical protein [Phytophthora infestans T30-4]|eukprot:XP_002901957.1 conserved hypothetical protein [Phytophthora infestans T30-4]
MIEQHKKHKAEVMAVTVSATLDANFVIAGDRQGRISAWERDAYVMVDCRGKVTVFMPVSGDGIHSMAISPHDKALVAVGYRSGVLCLVDAARGSVRHRLDGHDQEVQCVAWKPTNSSITVDQDDFDGAESDMSDGGVWLASSSRDKTIKVWKITSGEEPALEQVLRLPTGKQGMSFTQTKQLWLPVAWSLDDSISGKHCLWSGSFDGSLFRWEWDAVKAEILEKNGKNRRAACKPVVVKGGHSRMIFTIAMVPLTCAAESDVVSMLTVSLDRELRLWKENGPSKKLAAATCIETLTGLGGHAYSVSYNAATGLVAAGVGDQTIRLWDLNTEVESGASDYQCDLLWKGLQSKVTFVRWHPLQHSVLAYGMEDGRIGIYDIQTKKYNHFRTTHSSEVRQLQWVITKPKSNGDVEDGENAFLESIKQLEAAQAGGQSLEEALIAQEDQTSKKDAWADVQVSLWSCDASGHLFESNADAVDQKSLEITDNCVAFKWDEQCEMVAIGRSNGAVELMETCGSTGDCNTIVRRFHEHLESVTCVAWSNDLPANLLASGGQDGRVFVYNCGEATSKESALHSTSDATQQSHVMVSHSNKITCLRWSIDIGKYLLASASADGTVQVWNTTSMQREAHFNQHIGRVLSLDWVSHNTLITGGEDQTLRLWDYRKQKKEAASKLKKHGKVKQPQQVEPIAALDFFTSESKRFQDEREWESLANTLLIQGNIIEALRVVAKEGSLTPTWLSYAPMAGMDVWREMTNLYAHQLDVQGDKKEAALHFLSIGKVRSAVACLVSGEAFREALALIRSRLGPNDALLHNALWKYSDFLIKRGRNGEAALALLQIGSVKAKARAVNTLVNTADIECVKAALDVLMVSVQRPAEPAEQDHKSDTEELAFPASFFLSIAGNAVTKSRFDVAETAGQLLQSPLVGSSSASHRLTGCLLSIVKAINEHQWMASRADKFWFQVLDTCRRCGYWFDADGEVRIQEAQDLLVEANCFSDIEQAVAASKGNTMPSLLQVAQKMLRFVIDVMSTSFIGALEHMREVLQLLTKGETSKEVSLPNTSLEGTQHCVGNLQVNVMTLLQPCGFASPNELPQCGELAEEQLDTLVLWTSVLLSHVTSNQ